MHHKHTLTTAVLGALIYLSSDLGTGGGGDFFDALSEGLRELM